MSAQDQLRQIIYGMKKLSGGLSGVWDDDFNGASLDTAKWTVSHSGGFTDPVQASGNLVFSFVPYTTGNGRLAADTPQSMVGKSLSLGWSQMPLTTGTGYGEVDATVVDASNSGNRILWNYGGYAIGGVLRIYNNNSQVYQFACPAYSGVNNPSGTPSVWRLSHSGAGSGTWKWEYSLDSGSSWTTYATSSAANWTPSNCNFTLDAMYWGASNPSNRQGKLNTIFVS